MKRAKFNELIQWVVNQRGYSYASSEFVGTLRAVLFYFFVSDRHVVGQTGYSVINCCKISFAFLKVFLRRRARTVIARMICTVAAQYSQQTKQPKVSRQIAQTSRRFRTTKHHTCNLKSWYLLACKIVFTIPRLLLCFRHAFQNTQ